jgi:hypothetical protein
VVVLEVLALALWIPLGVAGVWLLATGRKIWGLPTWLKEGWQLRVFGLAYFVIAGYLTYRAIHDGSFSADGLVAGYVAVVALGLVAIYRRQKARNSALPDH